MAPGLEEAPEPSRRRFLKYVGLSAAAAAAASAGGITLYATQGSDGAPQAFAFSHAEDIALWIGNGERFTIKVLRKRQVLEQHDGVRADRITDLVSDYFSAHHIAVPTAA